ncbi:D-glycerate dehydrogenase [Halobacillus halophilus]|uniref:Probable 2-hydroxyacid dehydrogenase (NAD) n=1 Tax=Halobacillus halophilus (strain ATCC 35676 / DSM 2266 / JCM 20832 / KCTC 3685 / LMG 17431 / NBRC 102448 / NCIMB 2269) TaxID=866895 RepID=I0JQ32_HALH3|nr:D-glycerate dehydrogenase [Halobacillus halophilus]ASF40270.1 D-glycerate dehydrogenase [Halobacillus halophilus]CCG46252.1 probable 2-hydroxyacid dehydrogenase (NAD) [Halobacillus halophilus DSM 2266]
MQKPYVFITRALPESVIAPYRKQLNIEMWPEEEKPVPREVLLEKSAQVDGLLTMLTDDIDQELLKQTNTLNIVANLAVGYDNIDITYAEEKQVVVTNTPDVLTDTTADLTFGLLMAAARRIVEASEFVKRGEWGPWSPLLLAGSDIHHKNIGIVGMGRIGEAVAKRAKGFDMNILYHNRSRNKETEEKLEASFTEFHELIEQSDFVVSMVPLTPETHHMFDQAAFQRMKSEAIFINASRGAVVDEQSLYEALVNNEIAGAGLDVFEKEPIGADHPLLQLNQVVCLPHIGSATRETRINMMELCLDNICRFFNGKNVLTPVK